nr:MAG TPA: hypothetical protein [Caudoviricetes sp.]
MLSSNAETGIPSSLQNAFILFLTVISLKFKKENL